MLAALFCSVAHATEYGDLHSVRWCPCNPDEKFDAKGSIVLGRTVMCPCDSMYAGYGRSMENDLRKIQEKAEQTYDKIRTYKYYVGFEYNKSQVETTKRIINFNDVAFMSLQGVDVPASQMVDHQDNIGVVLGFRPHRNFGFEAFYNRSYKDNEVTQYDNTTMGDPDYYMLNSYTTKYQSYGIDLIGYLPVTQFFEVVAMIGLGEYRFNNTAKFEIYNLEPPAVYSCTKNFSDSEIAYRVGGGVQFNIARGVAIRLMYKFINIDSDTIKYLQEYSASMRFLF